MSPARATLRAGEKMAANRLDRDGAVIPVTPKLLERYAPSRCDREETISSSGDEASTLGGALSTLAKLFEAEPQAPRKQRKTRKRQP